MQKLTQKSIQKLKIIFFSSCLVLSLLFNSFFVEFSMAGNTFTQHGELYMNLYEEMPRLNDGETASSSGSPVFSSTNSSSAISSSSSSSSSGLSGTKALSSEGENIQNSKYSMTDAKHKLFKKENRDYVLADAMLNFTWSAIKKQSSKDEFSKILEDQRFWLERKRDAVANSFSLHLSESNAFTLAIVARTQELASQIFVPSPQGIYLYAGDGSAQGGHLTVVSDGTSLSIHGQSFAKSGNTCEIKGKGAAMGIGKGEGKGKGKGWISLVSPENEKFFVLFAKDTAYVVHGKIGLCGKNVSFQGMYKKNVK